ncbi:hypothetical protein [Gracilibacillus sp. YIM 98692]|uniref:hypothetical protein n=1 Tax=Gracilibacillus sp. YIM 98692 TaxID=2663532 RepID=UPI0013D4B309|nr:hypothetical protein [Gracilibacillus sp. YIM 98692]
MKNSYELLFDEYVIELDKAVSFEEDRLDNIRERMLSDGKSQVEIDDFIMERFDPICCSGRVIAVFRKYWLKCNELNLNNGKNSVNEYVNPKEFTVDWLSKNGDPYELFGVISEMPYYPIGIDENGDYC